MSFSEHVLASMKWAVDHEWGSQQDVKGFLAHVGYMAMKTMGDLYIPKANVDYDKGIRQAAANRGVKSFCGGNWDLSMVHYRYENTWQAQREKTAREAYGRGGYRGGYRGGSRGGRGYSHSPPQQQYQQQQQQTTIRKGPCDRWNNDQGGCNDSNCGHHHTCMHCWDLAHRGPDCKDRGSLAFKQRRR